MKQIYAPREVIRVSLEVFDGESLTCVDVKVVWHDGNNPLEEGHRFSRDGVRLEVVEFG